MRFGVFLPSCFPLSCTSQGIFLVLCGLLLPLVFVRAEDKKAEDKKKDLPRIVVTSPLGISPGVATKVTVRGVKLDAATEVRFKEPKTIVKLLTKTKVGVPNGMDVNLIGDSQVEIEVKLPPDAPASIVGFVVVNSAGESPVHTLQVDGDIPVVAEKEPNNGFREAQPIAVPQIVEAAISQAQDVDVFRIEAKAGQTLLAEVFAARLGSALDSTLTIYDAEGHDLASCDDIEGSKDSRLEFTIPKDGAYFLSVMDANDQGGPAHVYRLVVKWK